MEFSKLTKIGGSNSLKTTIPLYFKKRLKVEAGDHLKWREDENGVITVNKAE